jgi:hypothetical protein
MRLTNAKADWSRESAKRDLLEALNRAKTPKKRKKSPKIVIFLSNLAVFRAKTAFDSKSTALTAPMKTASPNKFLSPVLDVEEDLLKN